MHHIFAIVPKEASNPAMKMRISRRNLMPKETMLGGRSAFYETLIPPSYALNTHLPCRLFDMGQLIRIHSNMSDTVGRFSSNCGEVLGISRSLS